jgi:alkylhydroperoxidase family enzyme
MGIGEQDLLALHDYRDSDLFGPVEKLAIELGEAMTRTPVEIPDGLRAALLEHLTRGQLVELASAVAWENHRARLNRALGVREAGFSDGAFCLVPER